MGKFFATCVFLLLSAFAVAPAASAQAGPASGCMAWGCTGSGAARVSGGGFRYQSGPSSGYYGSSQGYYGGPPQGYRGSSGVTPGEAMIASGIGQVVTGALLEEFADDPRRYAAPRRSYQSRPHGCPQRYHCHGDRGCH